MDNDWEHFFVSEKDRPIFDLMHSWYFKETILIVLLHRKFSVAIFHFRFSITY